MTDLRTYQADQVAAALRVTRIYLQSVDARPRQVAEVLAQLLFRDQEGIYWAVDPMAERWYRWQDGDWQASRTPDGPLEGVAWLDAPTSLPPEEGPSEEIALPSMTAAQAAATITDRLGAAYREGHVSSDQANGLLERVALVSHEGHVWRSGVQSGRWYAFIDGAWAGQPDAPADDTLLGRSELVTWAADEHEGESLDTPAAEALGASLLLGATTLPEPVTAPWDPPEATPPIWPACSSCGRENIPGSRYCTWCGKPASHNAKPLCPSCGSPTKAADRFCGRCGTPLT